MMRNPQPNNLRHVCLRLHHMMLSDEDVVTMFDGPIRSLDSLSIDLGYDGVWRRHRGAANPPPIS